MQQISIAEHLYMHIEEAGVSRLFGVPGDFSLGMLDLLESTGTPSWVGCATEIGAAYCADGYARANGLGVVLTTFGVGELSAATAIAGSTAEDVGVLHVVAAPPSFAFAEGSPLHHSFADGDLLRFKRAALELHRGVFHAAGETALDVIREAVYHWRSTGSTTYLLLPQDIALSRPDVEFASVIPASEVLTDGAKDLIAEFIDAYPGAVAVLGNVAQRRGLRSLIPELTRKQIPVTVLPNAKGLVDELELSYLGMYNGKLSAAAVKNRVESPAGRVLVGCTIADTTTGGLSHVFPSDSTLVIDAHRVSWNGRSADASILSAAECWLMSTPCKDDTQDSRRAIYESRDAPETRGPLDQTSMWALLSQHMPRHGRLFAETGSPHYGALDSPFPTDTVFECASLWSAIGYALPAALGASLSNSSRRVLAVVGDGAAQLTVNELGLIDRYGANPILVLVDNDGYTVERIIRGEKAEYNNISSWRWHDLPKAMGAASAITTLCETIDSFASAIDAAYSDAGRAHILVVPLDRYDATTSLLRMGQFLRAKADLPMLEDALAEELTP